MQEAVCERDALRERVSQQVQQLGALRAALDEHRFDAIAGGGNETAEQPLSIAIEQAPVDTASPAVHDSNGAGMLDPNAVGLLDPSECVRLQKVFLSAGDRVLFSLRGVRALRARAARAIAKQHARARGLHWEESTDSEGAIMGATGDALCNGGGGGGGGPSNGGGGGPSSSDTSYNSRQASTRQRTVDELVSEEDEAEVDLSHGAMLDGPLLNGFGGYSLYENVVGMGAQGGRGRRTNGLPITLDQEVYRSDLLRDQFVQTDFHFLEELESFKDNLGLLNQQVLLSVLEKKNRFLIFFTIT